MQQLNQDGQRAVADIASRYNLRTDTVEYMLIAVNNGGGTMAQFNCPELGGSGQWMRGGMTMVGDMFNNGLKSTVDNLCSELSNLLANTQVFLVRATGPSGGGQWWPDNLGSPRSSGSQNNTRYAVFDNRLAVDVGGQVTVYDTLDHTIGGVSQQQGGNDSLSFSSQYGTLSVSSLPVVSGAGSSQNMDSNFMAPPTQNPAPVSQGQAQFDSSAQQASGNFASNDSSTSNASNSNNADSQSQNTNTANEMLALIEKLGSLREAGVLSDEEFSQKKAELLARI